jgi:predicted TIM-barrel fold metal-dependent hydrolase
MGVSQVMYASDYRHWDSEFPDSVRKLSSIAGLSENQKRHVLGDNAIRWFGFKPGDLPSR